MEDKSIIGLFFERSETAIEETASKYGAYCQTIAFNILADRQDAEECVSDSYLKLWNAIPPQKPACLKSFLGKITRNLALDRWDRQKAQKRGGGELPLALDELSECLAGGSGPEASLDRAALSRAINEFLGELTPGARQIFVRRYWYLEAVRDIAEKTGGSEGSVKTSLSRSRSALKDKLEKEGFSI